MIQTMKKRIATYLFTLITHGNRVQSCGREHPRPIPLPPCWPAAERLFHPWRQPVRQIWTRHRVFLGKRLANDHLRCRPNNYSICLGHRSRFDLCTIGWKTPTRSGRVFPYRPYRDCHRLCRNSWDEDLGRIVPWQRPRWMRGRTRIKHRGVGQLPSDKRR